MKLPLSLNVIRRLSYHIVFPSKQSPMRYVPDFIDRPDYTKEHERLVIKSPKQQNKMRDSCKLAKEALDLAASLVKAGTTTDEIDANVHDFIINHNAYPSPLGYKNFPKSICTSVNNIACHGIPDDRELMEGDVINVDVTVFLNGFHGDCSKTFSVGNCDSKAIKLIKTAEECRDEGIKVCGPGVPLNRVGSRIQEYAKRHNFAVLPQFCGHGIGEGFHELPGVLHTRNNNKLLLEPGMTFTIEPVITEGEVGISIVKEDGWTAVSDDGSRSAQFEHTILITESGYEILTE
ncbi:DgyrCDS7417 [Dimorphilus gyrociliatus]|uniref:Methionine aminopeptidase n=1 Tax=Dimorphilus gyrociliatus TaxID=2664684 RepID=A0A7I8VQZ6_9ANNE|nr:DgyrCDS7417 [Dimorphilus gyrociliatus]